MALTVPRVIVPSQAGGGADIVARAIAQKLTEAWGQPVVVDNRIGVVGAESAAHAAAPTALSKVKAGKVRALAVASRRRAPSLPDLPTFAEAGYPGVQLDSRYGILAPAAMPRETIVRLNAAIGGALGSAEVRERYAALGLEAAGSTPQEYADYLRDDIAQWHKTLLRHIPSSRGSWWDLHRAAPPTCRRAGSRRNSPSARAGSFWWITAPAPVGWSPTYERNLTSNSGCSCQPASPARPIIVPKPVGTRAAQ
jgi:tripartite tricarboxylate transporter family receptor